MERLDDLISKEYTYTQNTETNPSNQVEQRSRRRRSLRDWRQKAREATDFKEVLEDEFFRWLENTLDPRGHIKSVWTEYTESEAAAAKAFADHGHYIEAMTHANRASTPFSYQAGQPPVKTVFRENPSHIVQLDAALSSKDVKALRNRAITTLERSYAERKLEKASREGNIGRAEEMFSAALQSIDKNLNSGETEQGEFWKNNIDNVRKSYKVKIQTHVEEALYDALQLGSTTDKEQSIKRSFERITELSKAYLDRFNPSFYHNGNDDVFFTYVQEEFTPLRKEIMRCAQDKNHVYHDVFKTPGVRLDDDDPKLVNLTDPEWDPRSDSLAPATNIALGQPVVESAYEQLPILYEIAESTKYPSLYGSRATMVEPPEMKDTPAPEQLPVDSPTWTGPVSKPEGRVSDDLSA